jgi:hypothetical protein
MADMVVRLTRRMDGTAVLKCVRADGTETWQKQQGRQAMFFPLHDLTHYAVETEFGFRSGFYRLIAAGWDITDTEGTGPRGRLPPEAITVEELVGSLAAERAGGTLWSAQDFNAQAAEYAEANGLPQPPVWSEEDLRRVRKRVKVLLDRWSTLASGATLELPFSHPR